MKDILGIEVWKFGDNAIVTINSLVYISLSGIVIWFAYRWTKKLSKAAVKAGRLDTGREFAITRIAKYLFIVIFVFIALVSLKVNQAAFTFLAPLLIGIGLGLQQVANDVISGLILLVEPSIRVNDIVEVDGTVARVKEIGLRTSTVTSREGVTMIIPNHKLVSEKLINWSTNDAVTRFSITVGVAYGSDVELVKKLLIEIAWKHTKIITNPTPLVFFQDFGESSLDFELVFWSNHLFPIEEVRSDIRFMIDAAFRDNDITIPFPQRDIHVIDTPKNSLI
ncbi:MAG: hypothetical protein COA58_04585 [Bacteroidetes bacterium]|nr:MAG: hypothetical protein COA58_04585 [Bacteroidota bacterium]